MYIYIFIKQAMVGICFFNAHCYTPQRVDRWSPEPCEARTTVTKNP